MVKISVIIPLYNKAPHIAKTLNSVLSQSLPPEEIIIIDDGSTDGSDKILESFSDPRILLIRQPNSGVSAARNTGATAARNEHIAFLDADDFWKSEHLKTLTRLIDSCPNVGLYSTAHEIHQDDMVLTPRSPYPSGYEGVVDDFCIRFAKGFSVIHSSCAAAKKSCLLSIGGFPVNVANGEDIITWVRLAEKYGMAHSNIITASYNRNAVNRASSNCKQTIPGSLVFLSEAIVNKKQGDTKGLKMLMDRIAFYSSAALWESREVVRFKQLLFFLLKKHFFITVLKTLSICLIPRSLLTVARKIRHHAGSKYNA